MINQNLLLETLRDNKIKSNQMYWNFLNDLKPYFWSSLIYRLSHFNNKHHKNCLSILLKLSQSHIIKPVTKSVTKPVIKLETKPVTKPETKPVIKLETKPETKPVTKPETKPITKPDTKLVTKPESKSDTVHKSVTVPKPPIDSKKNKPRFKGKLPNSAINNYKEWKKKQLNIDSSQAISRTKFAQVCKEDNFDKDIYNNKCPWFEYIKHNMIV